MRYGMIIVCAALATPLRADSTLPTGPVKPVIDSHYSGGFFTDYSDELSRLQTMIPLAQLDIATQLGLASYSQGFQHPVRVRFDDGGPALSENPFFYIEPPAAGAPYAQTLVVNVEAFAKASGASAQKDDDLHHALNYVMTNLMLNDAAGGSPDQSLPEWAQEGMAVYFSGMGPAFVEKTGAEVTRSRVSDLADDLNRPLPTLNRHQYANYYLAIRYIAHTGGSGTFQAFLSDLLKNPSAAAAIQDVLGQDWPTFEQNVRRFATDAFAKYAREDTTIDSPTRRKP